MLWIVEDENFVSLNLMGNSLNDNKYNSVFIFEIDQVFTEKNWSPLLITLDKARHSWKSVRLITMRVELKHFETSSDNFFKYSE